MILCGNEDGPSEAFARCGDPCRGRTDVFFYATNVSGISGPDVRKSLQEVLIQRNEERTPWA
jgi:hypothetical protein